MAGDRDDGVHGRMAAQPPHGGDGSSPVLAARTRLMAFALEHSLDELLERTLDEAEDLTGSRIGFYHFVDADQRALSLQNWSTRTKHEFCTAEGKGRHYPVDDAGVWAQSVVLGRPVIHNDYASLPERRGMPPGHAVVVREAVVPVVRGASIVAVLGVGNKPTDYTEADLDTIRLLADLAWDVAERKLAEAARADEEVQYRTLVASLHEGAILQSSDGRILLWNPEAERIFGVSSAQAVGETSTSREWGLIDRDGRPLPGEEHPSMRALRARAPVRDMVVGVTRPDLPVTWINVNAIPLIRAGEQVPYAIAISFSDVTEHLRMDEELVRLNAELEARVEERTADLTEALHVKSAFIANMSHELRTPLNSIIGFSGVMLQGLAGPLTVEQERQVRMIRESGARLLELVDDVLDMAKVESGASRLELGEVDPGELVRAVIAPFEVAADAKGITLGAQVAAAPSSMLGDAGKLRQALTNLVANAVKFTDAGSVVVSVTARGDDVVFEVADSGRGIEESQRAAIFDPFYQAPVEGVAKSVGTGLGLAIANHAAGCMGGRIELVSEPGVGSTFSLIVPRAGAR